MAHLEHMHGRLGYERVLAAVAGHCVSPLGREEILALRPPLEAAEIERRCGRLAELWRLAEGQSRLPLGGLQDLREVLELARPEGSVLQAEELQALAGLAHLIDRVHGFLTQNAVEAPLMARDLGELFPCPELHREIDRSLTPSGEIADAASPALGNLRKARRSAEGAVRFEIDRLLRDSGVTANLQDAFITQRHGRHVLPVIANNRGRVPGIVHDRSATGETLFIEPMSVVELTNDATEARLSEEAEVMRILAALTARVRGCVDALEASLLTLGKLDAQAAIAEWGMSNALSLTSRRGEAPLRLVSAHHPLLWLTKREGSVPLDLALSESDRAVIISGPNAGGKTTALKTVGLFQLLTQSGLPVPADASTNIPVPRAVHADIGDDQDILAGRSTFTAHMAAIAEICATAAPGDLVLLDELGTATDPQEGGALAVAIVEDLCARGCLVFATSHLALLKHWSHQTEFAQNASVTLDAETRRPTFTLALGLPGPSEALTVAGQVGLKPEILGRARELVPDQEQRLGELISDLQTQARDLATLREDAEKLRSRLAEAERVHREAAVEAERERRAFRRDVAVERRRSLAEAKAEIERRIANLPGKRELNEAKRDLEGLMREADAEIAASAESPEEGGGEFEVGQTVEILDARESGKIISLDEGRNQAQVETRRGMVLTVKLNRLAAGQSQVEGKKTGGVTFERRDDLGMELNLIGQRVEPALDALDKFLDEAASHGLTSVRVIHGHGTGALRKAVREYVSEHPLATRWRPAEFAAGGHGVTVVELRG